MFSGATVVSEPSTPSTKTNGVTLPLTVVRPRNMMLEVSVGSPDDFTILKPAILPFTNSAASPILPIVKSSAFTLVIALVTSPLRCVP